jgi:hypothetical protein
MLKEIVVTRRPFNPTFNRKAGQCPRLGVCKISC